MVDMSVRIIQHYLKLASRHTLSYDSTHTRT